jgi:hypothetical protein
LKWRAALACVAAVVSTCAVAGAEENGPRPYSIPWQLRPVVAPTVVRIDDSVAHYGPWREHGITNVTIVTGAMRIAGTGPPNAGLVPLVRAGIAVDRAPDGRVDTGLSNVLLGAAYAWKLDDGRRLNVFGAFTLPTGTDGEARKKGANARMQFDNAMFAVDDVAIIPGVSAAWLKNGATIQVETTLFHLVRARDAGQLEASKTNLTCGLHLGWFAHEKLSFGYELRYQRWLNAPFAVEKDGTGDTRDNVAVALGARLHLKASEHVFVRPGLAYHRFMDPPLGWAPLDYHVIQIDVPVFFI